MAMLRITSSKVVPYSVRAISSGRILSVSITNAFNGCDQVSSPICHHFSTDAKKLSDHKLAKFLKSEFKSKKVLLERRMPAIPKEFPFTINDDPTDTDGVVNLTRDFHGEKIDVVVKKPFDSYEDTDDDISTSDGDISSDGDDSDVTSSSDSEKDEEEKKKVASYPLESYPLELTVTVSKQNGKILEFRVSASPDASDNKINIKSLLLKERAPESSNQLLSFGPCNIELEEANMQIVLREYLRIRGIDKSNYEFLNKYMREKCRKHPIVALKMLRDFIAE